MSSESVSVSSFSPEYVDWEDHIHNSVQTPWHPALVWSQVCFYGTYEGPPNEMRSCSLAHRQSMWFVHLSCMDRLVYTSVTLPRLTARHSFSLPLSLSFCTPGLPLISPNTLSTTKNSCRAQTQLSWCLACNRIPCALAFLIKGIITDWL